MKIVAHQNFGYLSPMTKLLQQAFEHASRLPDGDQDAIASAVLALAGISAPLALSADDTIVIERSISAADRGDFATDDEVAAVWAKHSL